MTQAERERLAALTRWRDQWRSLAATVRAHAEERAIVWQELHIPEGRSDVAPFQLPPRLQHRFDRQERLYGDRWWRAADHDAKAAACEREIAQLRAGARERQPQQTALF